MREPAHHPPTRSRCAATGRAWLLLHAIKGESCDCRFLLACFMGGERGLEGMNRKRVG